MNRTAHTTMGLFATPDELQQLLVWSQHQGRPLSLVALTPAADEAATRQGLTYRTIEDCYDEDALLALGHDNFRKTEQLCAAVDSHLQACVEPATLAGFSLQSLYYRVKIVVDALLHRTYTLKSAIELVTPQTIVAAVPADVPADLRLGILTMQCLPYLTQQLGIALCALPPSSSEPNRIDTRITRSVRALSRVIGAFRRPHQDRWTRWRIRHGYGSRAIGVRILLTGYWSDEEVLTAWLAQGHGIIDRRLMRLPRHRNQAQHGIAPVEASVTDRLWDRLRTDQAVRDVCTIAGLDLWPLIEQSARTLLVEALGRHVSTATALARLLEKPSTSASVILGSAYLTIEDVACAVVARQHGVPTVVAQHGGFVGYLEYPMLPFSELQLADYFLCYGDGVRETVERLGVDHVRTNALRAAQPSTVGSAALDRLCTRRRVPGPVERPRHRLRARRTILYVPTELMGDWRYFSRHIYPDIWYWRLQRAVVERCERVADVELIVKLDPRDRLTNPLAAWARRTRVRRCRLVQTPPFAELLARADLILIDSPATTLLQALTTDQPIIVLADTRFMRLYPEAQQLLSARAIVTTNQPAFLQEIDAMLRRPVWRAPEPINDEFLCRYGTAQQDGRSAERAVHALRAIAQRQGVATLEKAHGVLMEPSVGAGHAG